jgi:hypothetical protein
VAYTHGLELPDLEKMLGELVDLSLLETFDGRGRRDGRSYGMTEEGGRLWELEREPPWSRFCHDERWEGDNPLEAWVVVKSFSLETGRAFLDVAERCGLYAIDPDTWAESVSETEAVLPWKCCPVMYVIQASFIEAVGEIDWSYYERHRTWWRTISELATLKGG